MVIAKAKICNGFTKSEQLRMLGSKTNDEFVTSKSISSILSKSGVKHQLIDCPSKLDMTEYVEKGYSGVVSFALGTEYNNIEDGLKEDIRRTVLEKAVVDEDGRYVFTSLCHLILVRRD